MASDSMKAERQLQRGLPRTYDTKWSRSIPHFCCLDTDEMLGAIHRLYPGIRYTDRNPSPGRFFAVNELKAILAHILVTYDIKLPGDSTEVPKGRWFGGNNTPDRSAQVLFRKRRLE